MVGQSKSVDTCDTYRFAEINRFYETYFVYGAGRTDTLIFSHAFPVTNEEKIEKLEEWARSVGYLTSLTEKSLRIEKRYFQPESQEFLKGLQEIWRKRVEFDQIKCNGTMSGVGVISFIDLK